MSFLDTIKKIKDIQSGDELNLEREKDQYWYDHAKKWFQIIFTWCTTLCIIMLATGFLCVFGKYIWCLVRHNTFDPKTEEILGKIFDWTMKIIIGLLAKSYFDKK